VQNDTIVHTWLAPSDARKVLDKGYRVVHASAEYFYLDCGLGGWIGEEGGGNSWCDPYKSWTRIHSSVASISVVRSVLMVRFDPFVNVTDSQRERVLGG
jgi:hexosaminidase